MKEINDKICQLEKALQNKEDVCSSQGIINGFPAAFSHPFYNRGILLIICNRGSFSFSLASKVYPVCEGETVFLPKNVTFTIQQVSEPVEVSILQYSIDPIKDILGNQVQSMHLYTRLSPDICHVWKTGEEDDVMRYMTLLEHTSQNTENLFTANEQKLLLLSLTYRLCSIFQRKYLSSGNASARHTEIFLHLIRLIDQFYMSERGVEFYADKLCLSPKYLSSITKSICGYTVQELVFKAIIRKCISLLNSTSKTILELSEDFNFPSASSFGTFFRKQTGMSPQRFRDIHKKKSSSCSKNEEEDFTSK